MLNKHWVINTAICIKNMFKQILKEREDNISTSCIKITLYKIMFDSETGIFIQRFKVFNRWSISYVNCYHVPNVLSFVRKGI